MSDEVIDSLFIAPATGSTLDGFASLFAICRGVKETDAQLRTRINNLLRHQPGPNASTLALFELLEKLGLRSPTVLLDTFMPVGHRP